MKIRVLLGTWLFAIACGAAHALGLGEILVNSRLNQPLDAEIVVRESQPGEAEQLVAKLASQEDFERVGLERSRMPVLLRFETGKNARGQTVIKVMSDDPVREPFLTLLVEANWSGGRLLREYGILLDPPVSAPASSIARTAPPQAAPAQPAVTAPLPADRPTATAPIPASPPPTAASPPARATPSPVAPAPVPRASAPPPGFAAPAQPQPAPAAVAPAPTAAPAPASTSADGSYTVQRGDTLYGIAREFAADAGVSADQMMLALQKDNASAFFDDNINALKAGVVLRIPDTDTAGALSDAQARAEVRRQYQSWTQQSAERPAPALADAGAPSDQPATAGQAPVADARLELVPPSGDAESGSVASGPAGSDEGGSDVAQTQVELQRTREDLRSRDQEVSELGSRVRDLEELNAKNARLLELKNAEVAELQRRLAEVDTAAAAAVVADAAPEPVATTDTDAATTAAAEADTPGSDDAAAGVDSAQAMADGDELPVAADDALAPVGDADDTIAVVGNEADAAQAGTIVDPLAAAPVAGDDDLSEAEWEAATAAGADPFAGTQEDGSPATADSWTAGEPQPDASPAAPVETAPSTPAATTAVAQTPAVPVADTQPWYLQPMVLGAGLIGLALLLLLVLLARRQRGTVAIDEAPKRSVSDLFGASAAGVVAGSATLSAADSADAIALRLQIDENPDDFGAHLELISLYYAENDRARFKLAAERFYDRPGSADSVEWEQVESMGEELIPDHPLFALDDDDSLDDETVADVHAAAGSSGIPRWNDAPSTRFDADDPIEDPTSTTAYRNDGPDSDRRVHDIGGTDFSIQAASDESLDDDDSRPIDFSVDDLDTRPPPAAVAPSRRDLDDEPGDVLPPLSFGMQDEVSSMSGSGSPANDSHDGGIDDAATKLELARAYLDMGDPDGARAMLEEVLGEGDTSQRDEARKLLATL